MRAAESPYLLENQKLNKNIFVKAVDKNGNERIAILPPKKARVWYKDYAILAILMLAVIAYLIGKNLWPKFIK